MNKLPLMSASKQKHHDTKIIVLQKFILITSRHDTTLSINSHRISSTPVLVRAHRRALVQAVAGTLERRVCIPRISVRFQHRIPRLRIHDALRDTARVCHRPQLLQILVRVVDSQERNHRARGTGQMNRVDDHRVFDGDEGEAGEG